MIELDGFVTELDLDKNTFTIKFTNSIEIQEIQHLMLSKTKIKLFID